MLEPSFPKQQGHLLCFSYHAFRGLTVNSHLFLLIEVVFDQYLPFFPSKSTLLLLLKLLINLDETLHFSGQIPCFCYLRQHIFLHGEAPSCPSYKLVYKPINYVFFPPIKPWLAKI